MHQPDYPDFVKLMHRLGEVYGKKITDSMIEGYWIALKDQHFGSVKRFAEAHTRTGKFLPKPFELRPKPESTVVRDAAMEAAFKESEARCIRNLEELKRDDPQKWEAEVKLRKADRLVAITDNGFPGYEDIIRDWRIRRGIHANGSAQGRNVARGQAVGS